ncbi:VOC family protein [Gaoshiqia sediminis]|uniref:VOC family protein n=1 Tax=Gaoshiqia sediminis TaxID=2986998 RepID=A0AA42C8N0_9BACT|nr:VOC family protein [Gaoshiqia sediminis]MCW0484909.1 VOC family protein [Gaoshiqia sediminis]
MLLHIALTIIDPVEIENFYKEVLQLTIRRKFLISSEMSQNIFQTEEAAEIYVMENESVQFEIFISCEKEKKVFSHVCLAYREAKDIYEKAVALGYKAMIKRNPGNDTYFIRDKNENLFEIKDIQVVN